MMTFEKGDLVVWRKGVPLHLSFPKTQVGTILRVEKQPAQAGKAQLDVEFDGGEVVYGVADAFFELKK